MHSSTPAETLATVLSSRASGAPALLAPEDDAAVTYGELAARVEVLARRLAALGATRGERVAVVLPNGPEIVQLVLAIALVGAAAAPLNPSYTASELEFFLGDIAPRVLLLPKGEAAAARTAAAGIELVDVTVGGVGVPEFSRGGANILAEASFEPGGSDDIALVLHTSGTTSRPKQVPLLQRNLMASARTIAAHYELGPGDRSFCVMPLFHIHGLVASTFATLASGGAVVVPRRFSPRRFWAQARETGTTWL